MARLISLKVYRNGELVGSESFEREPGGVVKIGRLASAHLHLDDEKVSRIHAVIEVSQNGEVNVIDMGSAEGTFVNNQKTNKAALKPGDEIRLGDTRLVVQGDGAESAPAPEPAARDKAEAALGFWYEIHKGIHESLMEF
jgi:pSer/pThr/pTyr-binding forkhead associated (FHA) protein